MHPVFNRNLFLVKEHAGLFKAASNFDIYDPESGQQIIQCREESLGFFTKMFRFTDYKRMTPFDITLRTPTGQPLLRVTRGITIFSSEVSAFDENNTLIGKYQQKLFSLGGAFAVQDPHGRTFCTLKGKWTGWEFRFLTDDGLEFAKITKKWAGIGKELFTSADNYIVQIDPQVTPDNVVRQLILGAVMCIDLVLKE